MTRVWYKEKEVPFLKGWCPRGVPLAGAAEEWTSFCSSISLL